MQSRPVGPRCKAHRKGAGFSLAVREGFLEEETIRPGQMRVL